MPLGSARHALLIETWPLARIIMVQAVPVSGALRCLLRRARAIVPPPVATSGRPPPAGVPLSCWEVCERSKQPVACLLSSVASL